MGYTDSANKPVSEITTSGAVGGFADNAISPSGETSVIGAMRPSSNKRRTSIDRFHRELKRALGQHDESEYPDMRLLERIDVMLTKHGKPVVDPAGLHESWSPTGTAVDEIDYMKHRDELEKKYTPGWHQERTTMRRNSDGAQLSAKKADQVHRVRDTLFSKAKQANKKKTMTESSVEDAAQGLVRWIDNDGDLHRSRHEPIIKNLVAKLGSGKYDSNLAVKLFQYLADAGAQSLAKDQADQSSLPWHKQHPTAVRKRVAEMLRDTFERKVRDGNFSQFLPKKYNHVNIAAMLTKKSESVIDLDNTNESFVRQIQRGDRVTISMPHGGTKTGRAVMPSSHGGWVLNMGGAHGTPGIADDNNIVKVSRAKQTKPVTADENVDEKKSVWRHEPDPDAQGKFRFVRNSDGQVHRTGSGMVRRLSHEPTAKKYAQQLNKTDGFSWLPRKGGTDTDVEEGKKPSAVSRAQSMLAKKYSAHLATKTAQNRRAVNPSKSPQKDQGGASVYEAGTKHTISSVRAFIARINAEQKSAFSLGGAYGNLELWAKDAKGDNHRIEVGSSADVYNAIVRERFKTKWTVNEARQLSVPEKHQLNIAKKTLRMNDVMARVMGGMTKDQSRSFLRSIGWTAARIKQHEDGPDGKVKGGEVAEAKKPSTRELHKALMAKIGKTVRPIDADEYPPGGSASRKGLEGPFTRPNGKVRYYDAKAGRYYDSKTDMYDEVDEGSGSVDEGPGVDPKKWFRRQGDILKRMTAKLQRAGLDATYGDREIAVTADGYDITIYFVGAGPASNGERFASLYMKIVTAGGAVENYGGLATGNRPMRDGKARFKELTGVEFEGGGTYSGGGAGSGGRMSRDHMFERASAEISRAVRLLKTVEESDTEGNHYEAFYKGRRMSVRAATSYAAQKKAAAAFKAKKEWEVKVIIAARADGTPVVHTATESSRAPDRIDAFYAIGENGGEIDGVRVDRDDAEVVLSVYAALGDKNRTALAEMPVVKIIEVSKHLLVENVTN